MRLLFLGDVVGRPGRRGVARFLANASATGGVDFVVANVENAAGGKGIDPKSADELLGCGIDVLTTGNHVWNVRAIVPYLASSTRLLRPLNYAPGVPGRGWTSRQARGGPWVAVINLIGRTFMGPADCPFRGVEEVLPQVRERTPIVIVDMHAEATSEKVAMGRFLDGRVTAVVGTHTHVQTADESVLPGGTAYLTDAGMCGPEGSVLGLESGGVVQRFRDQLPVRFEVASGTATVQGAIVDIEPASGRATAITRIREKVDE